MPSLSLSVVVASGAGGEFLFRCLSSLLPQATRAGAAVIVVDRMGEATQARVKREYPTVQVIGLDGRDHPTIPQMRRVGVDASSTDIVAVLEEHCTAPDGWVQAILTSFGENDAAIGGPIRESAFTSRRDWCVYFSEYHNYLPPWPAEERPDLNGANIAYSRTKLLKHREILDTGYWEVVLHPRLAKDGRFRAVDAMGACHTGPFEYGYYLRQRYLLSRVWGGTQRPLVPFTTRLAHLLAGPIFPLFLFAKVTSRVMSRPQFAGQYVRTLPLLVPAWCCYAWGEWLGYLAGPGRALEEVE